MRLTLNDLIDYTTALWTRNPDQDEAQWQPNARLVRYYTNRGLLDRPLQKEGRRVLYGPRHLLQLLAIKHLQLGGASLDDVAAQLGPMNEVELAQAAGLSRDWEEQLLDSLEEEGPEPSSREEGDEDPSSLVVVQTPKGGSGSTTLAINLAAAYAATGRSVALVDLDLSFGDMAIMLNLQPVRTLAQLCEAPGSPRKPISSEDLDGHLVRIEPAAIDVLLAPRRPREVEAVTGERILEAIRLLRCTHEVVVVDVVGDASDWRLELLLAAETILLPLRLDLPRIKDAKLLLQQLQEAELRDRVRLILNEAEEEHAGITPKDVEAGLRMPVTPIPRDPEIPASVNQGIPRLFSEAGRASAYGVALGKLCRSLACLG